MDSNLASGVGKVLNNRTKASYYGFKSGSHTANGERWRPHGITAAHRSLPFGSKVKVTNLHNNKSTIVRINDRGPASWTGRSIDLSLGAAKQIGMVQKGTADVKLEKIK